MKEFLIYPEILKHAQKIVTKTKHIRCELLSTNTDFLEKRIAILGGSTTHAVKDVLDLFLLNHGIKTEFYESEFGQYQNDALFQNPKLEAFKPDIIIIHTSNRNIEQYPSFADPVEKVDALLDHETARFSQIWSRLSAVYHCPMIQNNFEYPFYRLTGNKDATDIHGRVNFITRLNLEFAKQAQTRQNFYINDINWLSADFGLKEWSDPYYWHMYKYSMNLCAIPYFCHNLANIIKSIYGKSKKAFALDLDHTLWGGVVGDDGAENIQIGQETAIGQVYAEFQAYLKSHKQIGVILNIVSKNEEENALSGLNRPDNPLKPDDFISIKANWEPKSHNLQAIADEVSLLPESFVFIDDNPAEREIVKQHLPLAAVPVLTRPEHYIYNIDRQGFFEITSLTNDDLKRNKQYKENAERIQLQASFMDYRDYLLSLEMVADILPFEPLYMQRIAQLTNKSNQFNLTTKRYTQSEIERAANDKTRITLYGKLIDKFGDNGVVSVVIGKIDGAVLHMELWLMSCRVLKREMEDAMLDELVRSAKTQGISLIRGYYDPTAKNAMVKDFYGKMGFEKIKGDENGASEWMLTVDGYKRRCHTMNVNEAGI